MKKNMSRKLIALALAAAFSTTLASCGAPAAQPSQSAPVSQTASASEVSAVSAEPEAAGTILLSVNPEIEMEYDHSGNVLSLDGLNDDGDAILASYSGYVGQPCKTVAGELVARMDDGGYFDTTIDGHERNIILKMGRGSAYPTDAFLDEIAKSIRDTVSAESLSSQTVALSEDDYDDTFGDKGYINRQAAEEIMAAQMGRDDIQFIEKDYDLDDGDYEVEFVMDGVEYEYEVNAYTGKVTEVDAETRDPDDWVDDLYDDDDQDDLYDDDWDDSYDDQDDLYDDDWDDSYDDQDDLYDDDWDDAYDDQDDFYDDDWDDAYDDQDDLYDDDWDDTYDDQDDLYDDDWDDDDDDDYDDWDDDDDWDD